MASQERFQLPTAEAQRVTKTVPPPAENEDNIAQHEAAAFKAG